MNILYNLNNLYLINMIKVITMIININNKIKPLEMFKLLKEDHLNTENIMEVQE